MKASTEKIGISFLVVLLVVSVSYVLLGGASVNDATCMDIKIWTDEQTYLPYEPLLIKYEICNLSDEELITSYIIYKEYFEIVDAKGNRYSSIIHFDVFFGDTLNPNERFTDSDYVQIGYQVLKPGDYTCRMKLPPLNELTNCLEAIESNVIQFSIVEPEGGEWEAYQMYLAADSMGREYDLPKEVRQRNEFEGYLALAGSYPRTTYAPIALYKALLMRSVPKDKIILVSVGKRLIEDYPDTPYGMWAFGELIYIYRCMGRDEGADEYLNHLKEMYARSIIAERAQHWMQKIEEGY